MHHDATLLRHDPTVVSRNDQRCNATVSLGHNNSPTISCTIVRGKQRAAIHLFGLIYMKHKARKTTRDFTLTGSCTFLHNVCVCVF